MAVDRKRGRPKGTGINDHEMLLKIAALLAADPAKKRTTAIKEIGVSNASVVRRLRDKYQVEEMHLMAEIAAAAAPVAAAPVAPAKASRKAASSVNGQASAHIAATETAAPVKAKKGKAAAGHAATTTTTTTAAPAVTTEVHVEPIVAAPHVEAVRVAAPQVAAPQATAAPQAASAPKAQPAPAHAAQATAASAAPAAAAKPALDPLAALFEGLNIETLVTQFIGHALGLSPAEIKNSPIPALIRQQAQLADLVLPLLAGQFMGQRQTAKVA